ncbi:hypothetical protein TRSC58_01007 [Trypanosoma rangeli SC58]|uniref:Uncharacterized protein n=1 Tax=Trypanosoma rangeli SC58 TaxID=429131 RepID=A0A061JD53_TRYRA|nr:hypothetical protein TRSC58_01007 [Trypanosoma rangeli SC58]
MAESKRAGAAAVAAASSSSSSSSVLGGQRRKLLEDIISSPELPHRLTTSNVHAEGERRKHPETRATLVRSEGPAYKQKRKGEKFPTPSPTARRLKCDQEDDVAAPAFSATSSERAADSSSISERDSLLERLREKEKQFDEKITALDETLLCAERGRLQRDSIIDGLRAEVARLRAQLELAAGARSQAEEISEKILKERTVALGEAHAEMEALRDKLREKDLQIKHYERELKLRQATIAAKSQQQGLTTAMVAERGKMAQPQQQQQQKPEVLKTLSSSGNAVTERERERERERQQRERYASSLRALQEEVQALERNYNITRNEKDALADENHALHSKLEAIQENIEARVAGAVKAMQGHVDQKRELEAEVVATRLSMARLLRLLREVPEMRRYLRVNEIEGDMLFTGYTLGAATRDQRTTTDDAEQHVQTQRRRNGGLAAVAAGTGVDDGVYGGNLMLQSSNVYLNGQWCKQLQDLMDDENNFLRRRKVCLGDMEDAMRCGRGGEASLRVPPASDVLQGRQNDKDFWIPYAVFAEAQKFKNRYFPSLSYESFYPFLTAVNQLWNEKTKRRVAAEVKRRLYAQQRKQHGEKRYDALKDSTIDTFATSDAWRQMSSSALRFWQQLQHLRHEVRRRVTGKNSLELFRHYDHLIKCTLKHLREVQEEHAALLERHQSSRLLGHARVAMNFDEDDTKRTIDEEAEAEAEGERIVGMDSEVSVMLRRALSALVEEVQEVSERSASRIVASCRDLQDFLGALRDQKLQAGPSQKQEEWSRQEDSALLHTRMPDSVPVSTLLRIIEGVLDFVDEVQREVFAGRNAVSRCATRAEERSELLLISLGANDDSEVGEAAELEEEESIVDGRRR